jgi:hypothetical protein
MVIKPLVRNINLLNLVLLSVAVVFSLYSLFPILDVRIKYALPLPGKSQVIAKETTDELQTPSVTEYAVISEKNLFHPDRKIPVEKKVEQPLPKPDFVLFGTLITGGTSLAYLEDLKAPRSTAGRGKRQIALRKGDTLSGFTLKEIHADKVVMVRGDETITLPVNPRDRTAATAASTTTTAAATPQKPAPQAPAAVSAEQRRQELRKAREERMQRIRAAREARRLRRQQTGAGQP